MYVSGGSERLEFLISFAVVPFICRDRENDCCSFWSSKSDTESVCIDSSRGDPVVTGVDFFVTESRIAQRAREICVRRTITRMEWTKSQVDFEIAHRRLIPRFVYGAVHHRNPF